MKSHLTRSKWHRLDNTANIFPVINNSHLTGVYRIAAILHEPVSPQLLEQAICEVLPRFEAFQVQLRTGFFWYYMEANHRMPLIEKEHCYPCRFINREHNNKYLFRTGYYKNKLYLEIFHALADGYGAIQMFKELTACYLRLAHPSEFDQTAKPPYENTSSVCEDSYLKYYRRLKVKGYKKTKAYHVKEPFLDYPQTSVQHVHIDLKSLKAAAKRHQTSITLYLAAMIAYSIYQEYMVRHMESGTICLNIPVNLRQFFPSETTMNFFSILLPQIPIKKGHTYTFEDILKNLCEDFKKQANKEYLEKQISYNVSNEKNLLIRLIPLPVKSLGVRLLYSRSADSFTTTLSNLGIIQMKPEYEKYIKNFHFIMGASQSQPIKCVACSFKERMTLTISSVWNSSRFERALLRNLANDSVSFESEGNGIHAASHETPYPFIMKQSSLFHLLQNWYILFAILTALGLTSYDFSLNHGLTWSLAANALILYSGISLRFFIRFNLNPVAQILLHAVEIQVLCILMDIGLGYGGWSLNYGLPGLLMVVSIATLFLMFYHSISWHSYFVFQIGYAVFSIFPILLWILGLITHPLPSIAAIIVCFSLIGFSIIFSPSKIYDEIKRRFHF